MFDNWVNHLIIVPILLPLFAAGVMLLLDEKQHMIKAFLSLTVVLGLVVTSFHLMTLSVNGPSVYLLGNWKAPFGIVLVSDLLSSVMLLVTAVLGLFSQLFSFARWDRAGPRFQALFMLLLVGVNGAFLTGDLFNLFVFFEVLLAASYGLALHGSGSARVRAGLHYIAINLAASSLFLIGAALVYGTSGTLNMADIAVFAREAAVADKGLFEAGLAILALVFLIKAGIWPLGFWLLGTYSAASAPVAAVFAIMTKVGIYAVLRLGFLTAGADGSGVFGAYNSWLFGAGVATIVYGSIVVLAARTLSRMGGACIFISSGTLLCALSIGTSHLVAGGLYYLVSSTFAVAAFFLLIELINRARGTHMAVLAEPVFIDEYYDPFEDGRIDETQSILIIPAALALLSSGFLLCALLLAGMPPLSGFIGKFALINNMLAETGAESRTTWVFIGLLVLSSFAVIIAFVRSGIEVLWVPKEEPVPQIAMVEFISVAGLLLACIVLTVASGSIMEHMNQVGDWLQNAGGYIDAVMNKPPLTRS